MATAPHHSRSIYSTFVEYRSNKKDRVYSTDVEDSGNKTDNSE